MHTMQSDIERQHKEYRELDADIQKKVKEQQGKKILYAKIIMAVNNQYRKAKYIKEPEKEEEV